MRAMPADDPAPLGTSELSPDVVLDLLDTVGLRGDGRVLQLNSFENRVFQVYLEDGAAVVAKFYRPGRWSDAQVLEEHAFAAELTTAEVPLAAPLQLMSGDSAAALRLLGEPPTLACAMRGGHRYRFAVTRCHAGRAPELDDAQTLRWIGRFIGRLHCIGARQPFEHRTTLDVANVGAPARNAIVDRRADDEPAAVQGWTAVCDVALERIDRALEQAGAATLRLHGDCHRGNLLWSATGPHFVDLDDACNGPAVQDLWMLLDGDRTTMRWQLAELISGYSDFRDFDWRETTLIEPLRTLRMIHYSGWIARRWHDPAFPAAFPWFGSASYWSQQVADLRNQIDAMQAPAWQAH